MRKIRFRAWDKKLKVMHVDVETYDYFQPVFSDGEEFVFADFIANKDDRFVLMQWIGLHVKNKYNIYEGDIITLDNRDIGGSIYKGEVIWNDDQTLGNLGWGLWTERGYLNTDFLGEIKIIGNIYKNPELLKGENNESKNGLCNK